MQHDSGPPTVSYVLTVTQFRPDLTAPTVAADSRGDAIKHTVLNYYCGIQFRYMSGYQVEVWSGPPARGPHPIQSSPTQISARNPVWKFFGNVPSDITRWHRGYCGQIACLCRTRPTVQLVALGVPALLNYFIRYQNSSSTYRWKSFTCLLFTLLATLPFRSNLEVYIFD